MDSASFALRCLSRTITASSSLGPNGRSAPSARARTSSGEERVSSPSDSPHHPRRSFQLHLLPHSHCHFHHRLTWINHLGTNCLASLLSPLVCASHISVDEKLPRPCQSPKMPSSYSWMENQQWDGMRWCYQQARQLRCHWPYRDWYLRHLSYNQPFLIFNQSDLSLCFVRFQMLFSAQCRWLHVWNCPRVKQCHCRRAIHIDLCKLQLRWFSLVGPVAQCERYGCLSVSSVHCCHQALLRLPPKRYLAVLEACLWSPRTKSQRQFQYSLLQSYLLHHISRLDLIMLLLLRGLLNVLAFFTTNFLFLSPCPFQTSRNHQVLDMPYVTIVAFFLSSLCLGRSSPQRTEATISGSAK